MSLAIESGASNTVAIYLQNIDDYKNVKRYHFGAANFKLLKPIQLESFLNGIKTTTSKHQINRLAIGMPGIIAEMDKKALRKVVDKLWPNLEHVWVGNDLETALACIDDTKYAIKCIVISGTGSCTYGNNGQVNAKIGGYGHILGDRGSGYAISHMALREALKDYEYNHFDGEETHEGRAVLLNLILKHLNLLSIYELVSWSLVASKSEIAELAQLVIKTSVTGNAIAKNVVNTAVEDLVNDIICLVNKLRKGKEIEDNAIQIGLTGSLLSRSEIFSNAVAKNLRERSLDVALIILKDTVLGALKMITNHKIIDKIYENGSINNQMTNEELAKVVLPICSSLPTTELRNPRSMNLDSMPVREAIQLMINEESNNLKEINKHIDSIEILIKRITHAFKNGGRLFYVGAGTSGRLGILDASECPPTFKVPPHWVQGIIAGGTKAIQSSIEGAEDSIVDGMNAIENKDINENDVVIGIAACGRTPFVWGSLYAALNRKAFTCLLAFNPNLESKLNLDLTILINSGPEVLTGSTRLKSGTGTKCVLNMLTTLSMVQYGKCLENLMIDLMPANAKLRDRAFRITSLLVNDQNLSEEKIQYVLERNNYDIKKTVSQLRTQMSNSETSKPIE